MQKGSPADIEARLNAGQRGAYDKAGRAARTKHQGCLVRLRDRCTENFMRVRDIFFEIDASGDGTLSRQEFERGVAEILGYYPSRAGMREILETFPTITPSDQLSAIQKWLEIYGNLREGCRTRSQIEILNALLKARGDKALSSEISAVLKTSIEGKVRIDVIELLLQLGATFENSPRLSARCRQRTSPPTSPTERSRGR